MDHKQRLSVMMADAKRRLRKSELEVLRAIDAQIVPLFLDTIEDLPTTKETLLGLVGLTNAVDDKLAELGHPEMRDHPRLIGAKGFFANPDTPVEAAVAANPNLGGMSAIQAFGALRGEVWSHITS